MSRFEVPEPILNSPFAEPQAYWEIADGERPRRVEGRRRPEYIYRPPGASTDTAPGDAPGTRIELLLVTRIRRRVKEWREHAGEAYPGVTHTTRELLGWWRREGRQQRLFFAQLEAAETIIFLAEAREDFRQGLVIPLDEPADEAARAFRRYACKMATGSGKTTVMAMLAAWSILNKVNARSDARFSDVVLVVCPNVTIRNRLRELDPAAGEASLYRTRDLVPSHLMPDLSRGRVLVTNWHVFEPQTYQVGGVSARVVRAGRRVVQRETIQIGDKTTSARGTRYLTPADLDRQIAAGLLEVQHEERDEQGRVKRVEVLAERFVESDAAVIARVFDREVGGKQNVLVMNDEAHHAYRIRRDEPEAGEEDLLGEDEEVDWFVREATVWVDGLDRLHKLRGINFCVDFSATPYFLGRAGGETNRPFPWVVSDFGLVEAIESGLVKIPQLAVRDPTGREIPGYFNLWRWMLERLTTVERGGRKGSVKPEAVLKWAHTAVVLLAELWDETRRAWERDAEARPPVFIIVCKNTRIAKVVYEWLAEDRPPYGVPSARFDGFRNQGGVVNTIRVDTRVVHETDTGQSKSDEIAWMRATLDTVGKQEWPLDRRQRPIYPEGFEELARRLSRPLHPPGRDVRCVVSVGMLTEGWDCTTVTHIIGLRPFMSQLLCEQVVGRGLRRRSYDVAGDEKLSEEVAKVLGVPFEIVPFKENKGGAAREVPRRQHVHALPERAGLEIRFPRVEGYRQAIRNRVAVDWEHVPPLRLDPLRIPPEIELKAYLPTNQGRPSLTGPGRIENVTLNPFRQRHRRQELVFALARDLTREYHAQAICTVPPHVLFPQLARIVERYLRDHVQPLPPAATVDAFLAPYYGWMIERLTEAIHPDVSAGEAPEVPRYESSRGPGSTTEVDFWTSREVRPVVRSHVNLIVADTKQWEQSAAYVIDRHARVEAFVKNAGLGFAIPYLHNGQPHDFIPDFIVRLAGPKPLNLVLEVKGFDPLEEVKAEAAQRWVSAVNYDGRDGRWAFVLTHKVTDVAAILSNAGM
jgi:type III restriction enzyme